MAPLVRPSAIRAVAAGFAALTLLSTACSKKTAAPAPVVGGIVGFDQHAAILADYPIVKGDPGIACGAVGPQFGTELVNASPQNARVLKEWGEVIPGKQMDVAGTIEDFTFSGGDLTFTHPFANDVTFDIVPQRPYAGLAQVLGTGEHEGGPQGTLHWELSQGLFPHQSPTAYLPGFLPQNGDAVASYGHWIVDCGHNDYHTELHPPTFVATGSVQNGTTVAHAFYVPYYETQLYTPNPSFVTEFDNPARLTDPTTRTFPSYLYHQLLAVGHVGDPTTTIFLNRLESHQLLAANTISPVSWYVCAQGQRPASGSLSVSYHFTVRPGVTITAAPESIGCVRFTATIGPAYTPLAPTRKDCIDAWDVLDQQAQAALGSPNVSIKDLIAQKVPPAFRDAVLRDPEVDCFDPLVVGPPGGSADRQVFVSASQPYPFYGDASVGWK